MVSIRIQYSILKLFFFRRFFFSQKRKSGNKNAYSPKIHSFHTARASLRYMPVM